MEEEYKRIYQEIQSHFTEISELIQQLPEGKKEEVPFKVFALLINEHAIFSEVGLLSYLNGSSHYNTLFLSLNSITKIHCRGNAIPMSGSPEEQKTMLELLEAADKKTKETMEEAKRKAAEMVKQEEERDEKNKGAQN